MRILTVTHYQPPHRGGIETVAAALVERYRRAGQEVVWLASDVPRCPAEPGSVRVPGWNALEEWLGVPYPLWHRRGIATVQQWVEWADVIHCHDCLYLGTLLALRGARRLDRPVLLTQHVALVPYRSALLRGVQRLAYATIGRSVHRRVDKVVFISRVVRAWFERQLSYPQPPLLLPNGVDTSLFRFGDEETRRAARRRLHLPADRRIFVFVGRFVEKKGISVVRELARRYRQWLFVLVGEGPLRAGDWDLDNIILQPFQPQEVLRDYYWACDVLLLPSVGEGFPLVVMEAMACGAPTLISTETFAAWNEGREHFLISEPNAPAIAALLGQEPPQLAPGARAAVASYARSHWDWDVVAKQYLQLLSDLSKQNRPAQSRG